MAAADHQRVTVQAFEEQLKVSERGALQALDALTRHQRIAMDAHEAITVLVFQRLQRLIQQNFAALVTQGDVLVIGNEVDT